MNVRGDAALAVDRALTELERAKILGKFRRSNLNGAEVADILDILDNHDALLELREPFYEAGAHFRVRQELGWQDEADDDNAMRSAVIGMCVLAVALLTDAVPDTGQVVRLVRRAEAKPFDEREWLGRQPLPLRDDDYSTEAINRTVDDDSP